MRRLLISGCVGETVAHEYLNWVAAQDLIDPEELLSMPTGLPFVGARVDRVYVMLQAVLAAVVRRPTAQRWADAIRLCAYAAEQVGIDPAVPAVRALLRDGVRPSGAPVPSEIAVFAPALALAGLLPGA